MASWVVRLRLGVILAAGLAALGMARPLAELAAAAPELPQWDMAKYGLSGLRLAQALEGLDLPGFLGHLHELSVWPPVFPLLETPCFLLFGSGEAVPRLLVVMLWVLGLAAVFLCGRWLEGGGRVAVGGLALAALAASPLHQLFGTLIMLEVPCALFQLLALGLYLRALEHADPARWRWAVAATTLLFFCKFNYGLLWVATLVLAEARREHGSWRRAAAVLAGWLRRRDWRRAWTWFWLLALAGLAALRLSGGFTLEIGGRTLRATSLGNPVYALYLLVLVRALLHPRRSWGRLRSWLGGLRPERRIFALGFGLPVAFWMLAPSHTKDFFGFLENRDSGLGFWSLESWLFYPRAFVEGLAPHPAIGWLALALAAALVLRLPWLDERRRTVALALVLAAAAAQLHPYKLPRFFFIAAPLVWLAAALVWVDLVAGLGRRARAVPALLAAGACLAAVWSGVDVARLERGFAEHTVPAAVRAVVEVTIENVAAAPRTVVLGTWNLLSPSLLEWQLRRHDPDRVERLVIVRPGRGIGGVERALAALPPEGRVVVLERTVDDAAWSAETAWHAPLRAALGDDPRFVLIGERLLPAAGYRLRVYSRSSGVASRSGPSNPLRSSSLIAAS